MLLGNLFEHYSAALFSLLSPFLAPLFFPDQDPLTALILTYCLIPLGMIARPLGSFVFGYIGDNRGRKEALFISLMGMAIITACLGFMPTYHQVGLLAPILLTLGRILQNFFAAGETIGGAIYLIENTPESQHDVASSLYNSSTIAGILIASAGVSLLCVFNLVQEWWRLLYFVGCSTAIFACLLRRNLEFTTPIQKYSSFSFSETFKICWNMRRVIIIISVAAGFSYATYTFALIMMNGFVPLITTITKDEMMHLNTVLLVLDFLLLPLFGMIANRFSREKMMALSGGLAVFSGIPLFWLLEGGSLLTVIFVRLCLVIFGVWFSAPFHAWAQKLVPPAHRYTVISFSYAIGSQLLGGTTAPISLWLFQKTNLISSVAWYWMLLGLVASFLIVRQEAFVENSESPLPENG